MWEILTLFFREALFYLTLSSNVGLIQTYIKEFFTSMIVNFQSVLRKKAKTGESNFVWYIRKGKQLERPNQPGWSSTFTVKGFQIKINRNR